MKFVWRNLWIAPRLFKDANCELTKIQFILSRSTSLRSNLILYFHLKSLLYSYFHIYNWQLTGDINPFDSIFSQLEICGNCLWEVNLFETVKNIFSTKYEAFSSAKPSFLDFVLANISLLYRSVNCSNLRTRQRSLNTVYHSLQEIYCIFLNGFNCPKTMKNEIIHTKIKYLDPITYIQ